MMDKHGYFMGHQFVWWQGVVEDVDDPLKLGRCRVRIVGFHNPDTRMIPTQDLPWAMVVQPVTSAALSEVGQSPTGLLPGSWVVGFFRDPEFFQEPVIMGSIAGIPLIQGVSIGDGFKDPSGKYPLTTHLLEPDLSRLARNEKTDETIVKTKTDNRVTDVTTALGNETWSEPEVPYAAKYPNNHVTQTASGHVQEFDDTTDHERIHTYHRSGTFQEMHPDVSMVNKVVAKKYEIIYDDQRILIRGKKVENIDKSADIKIGEDLNVEVEGTVVVHVKGSCLLQTDGDMMHKVKGTYNVVSEGNMTFLAPRIDFNPAGRSASDIGDIV
jgi:hypothetical protein